MRFHAEHRFNGPVDAVGKLLTDADFYVGLALPDLSRPEVLDRRTDGDDTVLRLRYEFPPGSLDPIASRLLGADRLAWIQEMRVDLLRRVGNARLRGREGPEAPARLGRLRPRRRRPRNRPQARRRARRRRLGIGDMAERRIVPGLLRRMDVEARALDDRLS